MHWHVSADDGGLAVLYAIVGVILAYGLGLIWLGSRLGEFRSRPELADLLPEQASYPAASLSLMFWTWSGLHRGLRDRRISTLTMICRGLSLAAGAALILAPGGDAFGTRLADFLNRMGGG